MGTKSLPWQRHMLAWRTGSWGWCVCEVRRSNPGGTTHFFSPYFIGDSLLYLAEMGNKKVNRVNKLFMTILFTNGHNIYCSKYLLQSSFHFTLYRSVDFSFGTVPKKTSLCSTCMASNFRMSEHDHIKIIMGVKIQK